MEKQIRNYLKILETSPDNVPAFEALATLYKDSGRWSELAELYAGKAQKTKNKKKAPALLFSAADIFAEQLANFERVEECMLSVLEFDPLDSKALDTLKSRYAENHRWESLVALLKNEAMHQEDSQQKADCLTEAALVFLKELSDTEKATDLLVQAQSISPDHLDSLRLLKTSYLKAFKIGKAVELVEREEALLSKKADKGNLYLEVGSLIAEDPFEKDRAIKYLGLAVQYLSKAKAKPAIAKLKELENMDSAWQEYCRNYMDQAINVSDKREASAIYLKIAGIYFLYAPDQSDDIMSTIEKSLMLDAGNVRAVNLGERFLMENEDWTKLAGFYDDIADRSRDEKIKAHTMCKSARLLVDKLDKFDDAKKIYQKVFELEANENEAFNFLADDLRKNSNFDELKTLLEDRLLKATEPNALAATHLQFATLAMDEDADSETALTHLKKAWQIDKENPEASYKLLELYKANQQYEKTVELFPVVINAAKNDSELHAYESDFALILLDELSEPEQAFEHFANAFLLEPTNVQDIEKLRSLTLQLDCWERLVDLLKEVLAYEEPVENYAELKFVLAQVFDKELSLYEDAEVVYLELLESGDESQSNELQSDEPQGNTLQTMDALVQLYTKDMAWEKLVGILGKKAISLDDIEEKRDVLLEVARVYEQEIVDRTGAIAAYNEVLLVMPDELEALKALEELFELDGNFEELAHVLVKELNVIVSIPEKIKLNDKLGKIYKDKLDNKEEAIKSFLAVLENEAAHLPAIEALEELLPAGIMVDDIFRGLEEYYRRLEKWDRLSEGYEALLKSEANEQHKGQLCYKLSEVYLNNRDLPDEAYTFVSKGLKTSYHPAEFLSLALEVARKVNKQSDLLEILETKSSEIDDVDESVELELSLGHLYWDSMQDIEAARKHFLLAALKKPEDVKVLRPVLDFFEQAEDWEQFAAFGDRLAAELDDLPEKKEILFKVAGIYETKLDDLKSASQILESVIEDDKEDDKALQWLLKIQQTLELWNDAIKTLNELVSQSENERNLLELKMQIADIYEIELEDHELASEQYSEILTIDQHHEKAFEALVDMLGSKHCEQQIANTLRPIYEERQDYQNLSEMLILQHEYASGEEAYQLAIRLSAIYQEEMNDIEQAFKWSGKAFLLSSNEGNNTALLNKLTTQVKETGNYKSFIELGDSKLEQEFNDQDKVSLLYTMSDIEKSKLDDEDSAWLRLEQILELDENHEQAIDSLIDLASKREDYSSLVEFLDKKRLIAAEKSQRREATLFAANVRFNKLEQPDEALLLLGELISERENDPQVFEQMELILQSLERFEDLKNLLERKLKYLREDDEILPVKIQIASILENNLDEIDLALKIYLELVSNYWDSMIVGALVGRLLAQESTELAIANEMEQRYMKTQDWNNLVNVHEIQLRHSEDPAEKAKLLSKLSAIYQDKLQDAEKAFEGFARVFVDDPNNQQAIDELEKLSGDLGAWKELAEVYVRAGEKNEDAALATELFIKAARLYEDILAYQEDSIRVFRKVLEREANNMTAIEALERLCRKAERWEELRDIYLQRVELTDDNAEKKELYVNICILFEHQLEDKLGTTPYYESILELTPHDIEISDKLLELYDLSENWQKKSDILSHKLELSDDIDLSISLRLAKANVLEEKLEDFVGAKDLYKSVIELQEKNETAILRLEHYLSEQDFQYELACFFEPYYLSWENWISLITVLEYQFNHSDTKDERTRLLKDMAEVYEDQLEQSDMAYKTYSRAFNETATDVLVQEKLEALAEQLALFEDLSDLYELEILGMQDAADAAAADDDDDDADDNKEVTVSLLLNLARIMEIHLHEMEDAAERYRQVLELSENHLEALANLERIYSLQKKWLELIGVMERRLDISDELESKKAILFQVCNLYEEELEDNAKAIDTYKRILELDENDTDVLRALVRLNTTEQRFDDLIEVRNRQLDITTEQDRAFYLRHQIGMVFWKDINDGEEACNMFAGVLEEDHHHEACIESMEELLLEDANEYAASKVLENLYLEDEKFEDLVSCLQIQANHSDVATDTRDLYLRMADIADHKLNSAERAFGYTISAFKSDAFNSDIREQMERLARATSNWQVLADAYRDHTASVEEVSDQVDLFINAGSITLRQIDDPAAAESLYAAVKVRQADNMAALDALQEIFERTEQWLELVDIYFTKAELVSDNEDIVKLYTLAANVREEKLDDKSGAVECYLKAHNADNRNEEVLAELDRLYNELEQFNELVDILKLRIALTGVTGERLQLTYRMASVCEQYLDDKQTALQTYKSILDDDDEYLDAIGSIENMVADSELQTQALDILKPLFDLKGWWDRLADILEVQFDTLSDQEERIKVLSQIKDTYEFNLSDPIRAFQVSCRIFGEDLHNDDTRQDMERLAVVTGGFEGLVNTYRSFFEQITDEELRIEILGKIASIYDEQLDDDENAIDAYRGVLELEPNNREAILALDRLYFKLSRFSDLVELIPREFELYEDKSEITKLRMRLGGLWEAKLDDNQTAIQVYRQVLDESPDHQQALQALENLYEKESMWNELVETFKAEVRIARGDTKKAHFYDRMAIILAEKMAQPKEAIPLWNRVLQFDNHNEVVRTRLEDLYAQENMWEELIAHYKKRLRNTHGNEHRASITKSMAIIYRENLGLLDQATQLFLKVLEYTPDDLQVIDTLEEVYLKNKSWRELVELLNRLLPQVSGAELRSLTLRLASIQIEQMKDLDAGEAMTKTVLEMEPSSDELNRLESLFRDTDRHELYLDILERQAVSTEDDITLVELNFRMAEIWQNKLDNVDQAKVALEKVMAIYPENLEAAKLLEPIYVKSGLYNELINVLKIRQQNSEDTKLVSDITCQIADIYENKLDDLGSAFIQLTEVFQENPADSSLLNHLESLAKEVDLYDELAELIANALAKIESDTKLYRKLTLKVAGIYEEHTENSELAEKFYKQYLDTSEYSEMAANFLISYYEKHENWPELVAIYQLKIPYMDQEEKVVVGCKVAYIFNNYMNKTSRAIKTYQQVLIMDENFEEAINALIEIFELESSYEELVEMLRRKLHLVSDTDEISQIRLQIAGIYKDQLDDIRQAKSLYRQIVVDNPKHTKALDELESIYVSEENYDELLEVLSRRVNVTDEDEDKISLYRKMAEIWEVKFEQLDMAVNYFEKILAIQENNLEAIDSLERIYRESGDFENLAITCQRHIDQTIDTDEIVRLYTKMGRIYGEHLDRSTDAIDCFSKALKIDEDSLDVMLALSELYIVDQNWSEAISTLERISDLSEDKKQKVQVLTKLGDIYLNNLNDSEKAKDVFERMVFEDPTFVPALRALRRYHAATKDWPNFLSMVEEEKRYVEDRSEKAELLYAEGCYYHEQENDVDRALLLYGEAKDLADDFEPVLSVLGRIFFERQQWDETKPILNRLLELEELVEVAQKATIHYQLAFIAEQEQNEDDALKHYTAAYKLDSNHLATLEGLARTLYIRGDWERAFRVYQTILVRFRDKKSMSELVDLFSRLGEVNGKLGKNDVAVRMYEKALEYDPDSDRALEAIVYFYESLENWKKVLQYRGRMIKKYEGDQLFEQWKAIGDIYSNRLENSEKGLEAYRNALKVRANDVELLSRVADLLMEAGNINDAIGVMKSAAQIESDPQKLFDLNLKLGELVSEHSADKNECLDYWNNALDTFPNRTDVFERIENYLLEQENWEGLDNSYRAMIARLDVDDQEGKLKLWKKLGTLLADKAENIKDAITAWEVVNNLKPNDSEIIGHLADLYASVPEYREQALEMHRELLLKDHTNVNSYRTMWKIAYEDEKFDKAFCYGGVVKLLGREDLPAAEFYTENLGEVKVEAINTLDPQIWGKLLLHEDARHNVGQILTIIFHHANGLMPASLRSEGLKKKDRLNLEESINICNTVTYAVKALGVPTPTIYMKKDYGPDISTLAMQPATLMIGSDAFEDFGRQRELTFLVAKNAVLARPDYIMGLLLDSEMVLSLLDAAALMFDKNFKTHQDAKTLKPLVKKLEKAIPRKVRQPLSAFVSEYIQISDTFDVDAWKQAMLYSVHRAAMLMCNDLPTAVSTLKEFPGTLSEKQIEDIISDMTLFSVSERYFHLREYLGFTII